MIRVRVPLTVGTDAPCFVNVRVLGGTHKNTMADTDPNAHADVDANMDPITTPWHTRSHAMTHELGHTMTYKYMVAAQTQAHTQAWTHTRTHMPRHTTPSQVIPWRKNSCDSGLIFDISRVDCVLLLLCVILLVCVCGRPSPWRFYGQSQW